MDRSQASGRRLLAMVLILANLVAVAAIVWTGAAADAAIGSARILLKTAGRTRRTTILPGKTIKPLARDKPSSTVRVIVEDSAGRTTRG